MQPAPCLLLKCPQCGTQKKVMSLMSGNTFGAQIWSDCKRIAPMLPQNDPIVKCPHCNYYYWIHKQPSSYSENEYFTTPNSLSFIEWNEALIQLQNDVTIEEERTIRIHLLWAFNDTIRHEEDTLPEHETLFISNVLRLLEIMDWTSGNLLFKAELHREIGQFDECLTILNNNKFTDDEISIMRKISQAAQNGNKRAFMILSDEDTW